HGQFGDVLSVDSEVQRFLFQARSSAFRACLYDHEIFEPAAGGLGSIFPLLFKEVDDAFEFRIPVRSRILHRCDRYRHVIAVEQYMQNFFRYIADWGTQRALVSLEDGLNLLEDPDITVFPERQNASATNAQLFVRNYRVLRNLLNLPQTIAHR